MMNLAKTTDRAIVPLFSSLHPLDQEQEADPRLVDPSYAIGPLDPTQILRRSVTLSTGEECIQLLPSGLPLAIQMHPCFHAAYESNTLTEDDEMPEAEQEEEEQRNSMVTFLVNHLCRSLTTLGQYIDPFSRRFDAGMFPWQVGWLLRDLTRLDATDPLLASVGLAHLCFLLAHLPYPCPVRRFTAALNPVGLLHDASVRAYRARVRAYRAQGLCYDAAQRLALSPTKQRDQDRRKGERHA